MQDSYITEIKSTSSDYSYFSHYVLLGCSDTPLAEVALCIDFIIILLLICISFSSQAAVTTLTARNRQNAALPSLSYHQNEWRN